MNNIKKYINISVFLLIVIGLGFFSSRNLVNFYVNQEKDYNEWTPELGTRFETDIASTFYDKFGFVNLNGAVCNILDQPSMNGVVKLNNGYLFTTMSYSSNETLRKYADSTIRLNNYLKSEGIPLVYANTPYTSSKFDPQIPIGIDDYGNDNCDRFIQMLKDADVDTIDFRQTMHDSGIDQYTMMYRTDHHWTTEAGFYAYGILEDYIVNTTGCTVDERISDIRNYSITRFEKWHLGSRGQRTGIYYAGIDDFDLIVPNFDTTIQSENGSVGKMQDLMIDMNPLSDKDYTSRYTYDNVLGDSLGQFSNLNCINDIRVLTIGDSFSKAVNLYLAIGFRQIDFVYNINSDSITPELIKKIDPDIVIMMYYPDTLKENGKAFSFKGF